MNIFKKTSYSELLEDLIKEKKSLDSKFTFQLVADQTKIPKSYLSKVINHHADLNADQLFKITEFLGLDAEQSEYMQILLDYNRCGVKARKDLLREKITNIQIGKLQTKNFIQSRNVEPSSDEIDELYYYSPIHQIVHICLSIPRYQSNPLRLAEDLGISSTLLSKVIDNLERMKFISRHEGGKIVVDVWDIHLSKKSKVFQTWRDQIRTLSLRRLQTITDDKAYSMSVTFTASESERLAIQEEFMKLLATVKPKIDKAKNDQAYQMNFDLFSWTHT